MSFSLVTPGDNLPDEINVIIEVPAHSDPVKYEVDHESGALMVDRFMSAVYPTLWPTMATPWTYWSTHPTLW
jgi:inorganic pyrophosphatase